MANPWGGIELRDITKQCTFSWSTAPTSVTAGTFPDSFIDVSHSTNLEFYCTHSGAGTQAQLQVSLPRTCRFVIFDDCGVGAQIGGYGDARREIYADIAVQAERNASVTNTYRRVAADTVFSQRLRKYSQGIPQDYGDVARLMFYSATAGDYAWEIFSIRIIEIVGV